jgi:transcriptional antiterminator RfaH
MWLRNKKDNIFMAIQWYAMRSKPRKEEALWRQAKSKDIEVYFPRIRVHPVNPRSRKMVPYFPGYIFVQVDLEEVGLSTLQWMPYSIGLVSFGGEPAPVPENLIHEIRKRVDKITAEGGELFAGLKPGEVIRINEGPFKGYEAIFDTRLPGTERVRVLLELLDNQRQVPLELDAGQIKRK